MLESVVKRNELRTLEDSAIQKLYIIIIILLLVVVSLLLIIVLLLLLLLFTRWRIE